jgi:predicted PurR-regulated permease PerM
MGLLLLLVVGLRLATPLLAVLFAYLALTRLALFKRRGKWLAVVIFFVLLGGVAYGLGYVINQTVRSMPEIADKSIPLIFDWAKQYGIELPFSDYDSLKDLAFDTVKGEVHYLGSVAKFARGAAAQFLFLVAGCVVAISIFLNPRFELDRDPSAGPANLYSKCCEAIRERFILFYESFVTVMGAQIVVSAINTLLTGIFVIAVQLPYAAVVIGMTFLCGMIPVVGNLVSNTIVVMIGFTVSPRLALGALIFLVVIHKLEYVLNSKIVGWRIRNPLWLTLLGLIVGERILGVPGMILAPVFLNYLKREGARKP